MDLNSSELEFRTLEQVRAYSNFFLRTNPLEIPSDLTSEEEFDLKSRRELSLMAQLDHFKNINFSKANVGKVDGVYTKICKKIHKEPLSSKGASEASSRFNYKENALFRNRTIYLAKSKLCCEIELFHLEEQRELLKRKFVKGYYTPHPDDIVLPDYNVYEYSISLDNVLILTSKPCADSIRIGLSAIQNEWFDLNDEYDIPSASQILGTVARTKGYKGILYTSIRHQIENNLVIFEENSGELDLRPTSTQPYQPSEQLIKVDTNSP